MYRKLLVFVLIVTIIAGCKSTTVDPTTSTLQQLMKNLSSEGDLYAQAVTVSGLIDDLTFDRAFPLLFIAFYEGALESYIAEEGLSEDEFLTHPKLRNFLDHHLIPGFVDLIEIRSTPNGSFTYTSAADAEVIFTTGEDLIQTPERLNVAEVNGIPFSPYCLYEGENGGQLCYADAPITEDFDWSE